MSLSTAIHNALNTRLALEASKPPIDRSYCQEILPTFTEAVKKVLQQTDPSINYISVPFPKSCGQDIKEHLEKEGVTAHVSPIIPSINHANTFVMSFNLEKKRSMTLLSEH